MKTIFILLSGFSKYYYIMFWHFKNIQVYVYNYLPFIKPANISPILNIWVNMKWILKTWNMWWGGLKKKLLKSQCCVIHALHHGKMMEKLNYQHFFYEEKNSFFQVKCKKEIAPFLYTQREYSANYSHRCSWNLIFESVNSNEFATQITP